MQLKGLSIVTVRTSCLTQAPKPRLMTPSDVTPIKEKLIIFTLGHNSCTNSLRPYLRQFLTLLNHLNIFDKKNQL